MLYALDLFSGIGGNSIGLKDYVRTLAYCEADRHAQAVLLSRMSSGDLPIAPICTDVTQLDGRIFKGKVDIIIAGFPCQDISSAGKGAGLEGKRSGLFYEVVRLAKEIEPAFLFLENVAAIRTRGLDTVIQELTEAGYDCRWTLLPAADVGAPHKRERWFYLAAHTECIKLWEQSGWVGGQSGKGALQSRNEGAEKSVADSDCARLEVGESRNASQQQTSLRESWWSVEPDVGRVAHGVPQRVDRIKRLGNAVVPAQAKAAFEILMGTMLQ